MTDQQPKPEGSTVADQPPKPPLDRQAHCQQIGTLGGQETVRRYGLAYMREIARAGFQTTCARYYAGNRAHARAALIQRRRHFRDLHKEHRHDH